MLSQDSRFHFSQWPSRGRFRSKRAANRREPPPWLQFLDLPLPQSSVPMKCFVLSHINSLKRLISPVYRKYSRRAVGPYIVRHKYYSIHGESLWMEVYLWPDLMINIIRIFSKDHGRCGYCRVSFNPALRTRADAIV